MLKKTIEFKKKVREIRKEFFSLFLEDGNLRGFSNDTTWCYYIENILNLELELTNEEKRKIINLGL